MDDLQWTAVVVECSATVAVVVRRPAIIVSTFWGYKKKNSCFFFLCGTYMSGVAVSWLHQVSVLGLLGC